MGDTTNELHRDIGEHEGRLSALEQRLDGMEKKQDQVLELLYQAKGGYKTLMLVAGAAGAVGALIGKFVPIWK